MTVDLRTNPFLRTPRKGQETHYYAGNEEVKDPRDNIAQRFPNYLEKYDQMLVRDGSDLPVCPICQNQKAEFDPESVDPKFRRHRIKTCKPCAGFADGLYRATPWNLFAPMEFKLSAEQVKKIRSGNFRDRLHVGVCAGIPQEAVRRPGHLLITEDIESGFWIYTRFAFFNPKTRVLTTNDSRMQVNFRRP